MNNVHYNQHRELNINILDPNSEHERLADTNLRMHDQLLTVRRENLGLHSANSQLINQNRILEDNLADAVRVRDEYYDRMSELQGRVAQFAPLNVNQEEINDLRNKNLTLRQGNHALQGQIFAIQQTQERERERALEDAQLRARDAAAPQIHRLRRYIQLRTELETLKKDNQFFIHYYSIAVPSKPVLYDPFSWFDGTRELQKKFWEPHLKFCSKVRSLAGKDTFDTVVVKVQNIRREMIAIYECEQTANPNHNLPPVDEATFEEFAALGYRRLT